jgi:hypothetical protein
MPIPLSKIVLGYSYFPTNIPANFCFVFRGIFIFQIFLLLSTGISYWTIDLYKEYIEKGAIGM